MYLWVVTEGASDYVYRFTINRTASTGDPSSLSLDGSWKLAAANSKPTGITLNPSPSCGTSLWVVDEASDVVYEYGQGRSLTSGTGTVTSSFSLGATNLAPQGIADPIGASLMQTMDDTFDPVVSGGLRDRGQKLMSEYFHGQKNWEIDLYKLIGGPGRMSIGASLEQLASDSGLGHHGFIAADLTGRSFDKFLDSASHCSWFTSAHDVLA